MKMQQQSLQEPPVIQVEIWMTLFWLQWINRSMQTRQDWSTLWPSRLHARIFQIWILSHEQMECACSIASLVMAGLKLAWQKSSWTTLIQSGSKVSTYSTTLSNAKTTRSTSMILTTLTDSMISDPTTMLVPYNLLSMRSSLPGSKHSNAILLTMPEQRARVASSRSQPKRKLLSHPKKFSWNALQPFQAWPACISSWSISKFLRLSGNQSTSQKLGKQLAEYSGGTRSTFSPPICRATMLSVKSASISCSHRSPESTNTWVRQRWPLLDSKRDRQTSWLQTKSKSQ